MRTKVGIIYALENIAWDKYAKCGRTTREIKYRIRQLQTSLLEKIQIIATTNTLVDTHFYEYLLKIILKDYRVFSNKEMFCVDNYDVQNIFNFFNELNDQFNTEEKLNWYIHNFYPEYLKKKKNCSSEKKSKKRKAIFIDTSYSHKTGFCD